MKTKWNVMPVDLKVIKSNVNQNKAFHCKPKENIKVKTRKTGRNTTIWKYQKH